MKPTPPKTLKVIKGNGSGYNQHIAVQEITKLPLAICRQILNSEEVHYTDEEVLKIRDFFYDLAAIAGERTEAEEHIQEAKLISLTEDKNNIYAQSDHLRTG